MQTNAKVGGTNATVPERQAFCRRGASARSCPCTPRTIWATAVGQTRCCICVACSSHLGAYSSGIGFCPADSVYLHSPVLECGVAQTLSVCSRVGSRCYGLCDEQVFGWRLGGTLGRSVIQQSLPVLAISGMAVPSRAGAEPAMDDTGHRDPSWHRNYPPGNGNIFRYQSYHSSFT